MSLKESDSILNDPSSSNIVPNISLSVSLLNGTSTSDTTSSILPIESILNEPSSTNDAPSTPPNDSILNDSSTTANVASIQSIDSILQKSFNDIAPTNTPNNSILNNTSSTNNVPPIPDEFADVLDQNLGRANGNVYISKPGIENIHDGQIMVRLKKKRCIIIDYAKAYEDATDKNKEICVSSDCKKIGRPILLYDSVPSETPSLYMRTGLCFTCQRALNEKRRTQRKRKRDVGDNCISNNNQQQHKTDGKSRKKKSSVCNTLGTNTYQVHQLNDPTQSTDSIQPFMVYNPALIVPNNAIVICGPLEGTKPFGPDYGMKDISNDIRELSNELAQDMDRLFKSGINHIHKLTSEQPTLLDLINTCNPVQISPDIEIDKIPKQSKETNDQAIDSPKPLNVPRTNHNDIDPESKKVVDPDSTGDNLDLGPVTLSNDDATSAVNAVMGASIGSPSTLHVRALYEKTLFTMKKSIYLLSQWKSSWDAKQHEQQQVLQKEDQQSIVLREKTDPSDNIQIMETMSGTAATAAESSMIEASKLNDAVDADVQNDSSKLSRSDESKKPDDGVETNNIEIFSV